MNYQDLVCDFAKRTLANHKSYYGKYEVTNLINSSLGLFVFPEQKFFNEISDELISAELFNELKRNIESNYNEPINFKNICNHIRNGISHFRLEIKANNCSEITEVIIKDKSNKDGILRSFKITFSIKLLERFFLEFSDVIIK